LAPKRIILSYSYFQSCQEKEEPDSSPLKRTPTVHDNESIEEMIELARDEVGNKVGVFLIWRLLIMIEMLLIATAK
jgi:hypothetical protein